MGATCDQQYNPQSLLVADTTHLFDIKNHRGYNYYRRAEMLNYYAQSSGKKPSRATTQKGYTMEETPIITPEGAENPQEPVVVPAEQTMAEIVNSVEPKDEPKTVGLDKFLELKKELKTEQKSKEALVKRIEALEKRDNSGEDLDLPEELKELAEEFDVDPKFLSKLKKAMSGNQSIEDIVNAKIAPLTEKERQSKISEVFAKAFGEAINSVPEYKEIVNPDVIKSLSLQPENSNKTFVEIIEMTYGGINTGKRTIETTTPGGGKEPLEVDFAKADKDPEYFREVMANPTLKKKYNEQTLSKLKSIL